MKTAKQVVKKTVKKEVAKVKQTRRGQAVFLEEDLYNRITKYAEANEKAFSKVVNRVLSEWIAENEG